LILNGKFFPSFLHLKISLETLSTVEMEDMDTEENSPPDQYAVLKQQLEMLVKESQVQTRLTSLTHDVIICDELRQFDRMLLVLIKQQSQLHGYASPLKHDS